MKRTDIKRLFTSFFGLFFLLSTAFVPVSAFAQKGGAGKSAKVAKTNNSNGAVRNSNENLERLRQDLVKSYGALADSVLCETYIYKIVGEDTLCLDLYYVPREGICGDLPVFIYSFGGAWEGGQRQNGAFLEDMAKAGFIGVAIDYRLGIKKMKEARKQGKTLFNGENPYVASIKMAIEDLYDATMFCEVLFLKKFFNNREYIISGSSAGAINSLTAEYLICQQDTLALNHLPKDFNYSGVVAFAGGIWTMGDTLIWKQKPCPVISFHGTKDKLVPIRYQHDKNFNASAFGPEYFLPMLKRMGVSHVLNRFESADHEIAILAEWGRSEFVPKVIEQVHLLRKSPCAMALTNEYPQGYFRMVKPVPPRVFPNAPDTDVDKVALYHDLRGLYEMFKGCSKN